MIIYINGHGALFTLFMFYFKNYLKGLDAVAYAGNSSHLGSRDRDDGGRGKKLELPLDKKWAC